MFHTDVFPLGVRKKYALFCYSNRNKNVVADKRIKSPFQQHIDAIANIVGYDVYIFASIWFMWPKCSRLLLLLWRLYDFFVRARFSWCAGCCLLVVVDGDNNNTSSRARLQNDFPVPTKCKKKTCLYIPYLCTNTMWLRTLTYCFKKNCFVLCCLFVVCFCLFVAGAMLFIPNWKSTCACYTNNCVT